MLVSYTSYTSPTSPRVPVRRLSDMCCTAIRASRDAALHGSAGRLLRYLLALDDTDADKNGIGARRAAAVAAATAAANAAGGAPFVPVLAQIAMGGAIGALSRSLVLFASDKATVDNALHIICCLLVHPDNRRAAVCPVRECAEAVVALLGRSQYADDTNVLGLGATVLRNLACVAPEAAPLAAIGAGAGAGGDEAADGGADAGGRAPAPAAPMSPALIVTQAGAATVLEDMMSRHPAAEAVQENGRCALYNLLLIGAQDVTELAELCVPASENLL